MYLDTNLTPYSDSPLTEIKLKQKQATSPIIFSSKKSGYILEILGDAGVAAGELEKLKRVYGDFVKQNQYVEIRVRIPDVHSYLDPLDVARHDCICIALKGDYLKVGAPVQASFENPVDTRRGYIINSQNVTGDGSQAESKDEPDGDAANSEFLLYASDKEIKEDNKPVNVNRGFLGLPFKCEVKGKLKGLRQLLIREAEAIAENAGWYYGATQNSSLIVQSGKRPSTDGSNNGNHQTGNAFDFEIEIDNKKLGRMESYAFVATMIEYGLLRSKRMGLYLDPKIYKETNSVVGFYRGSYPHYDLRIRKGKTLSTQRWVRFYPDPTGDATIKKAGSADFKNLKLNALDQETALRIPKSVRLRIKQLYYGFDPYVSFAGTGATPRVSGLKDEVQKQKDSWDNWKKTKAGESFGGAANSSSNENQNKQNDGISTKLASLAWKLSNAGPLQNFDKSPDKEALSKVDTRDIADAIAALHYNSLPNNQDPNKQIKVGAVGIVNNKILMNRPYPTRVTIIPVFTNAQQRYFNYWKGQSVGAGASSSAAIERRQQRRRVANQQRVLAASPATARLDVL
jgi:hypothetical protein